MVMKTNHPKIIMKMKNNLSYEMQDLGLEGIEFNGNVKAENESLVLKFNDSLGPSDDHESVVSRSFQVGVETQRESEFVDIRMAKNQKRENKKDYLHALRKIFKNENGTSRLEYNVSNSLNVRAAAVHVFSDIIQSLKNLTVACCIYSLPNWTLLEPI